MGERVFTDKSSADAIFLAELLETGETQARNDRNRLGIASIPLIFSSGYLLIEGIQNNSPLEVYAAEMAALLGLSFFAISGMLNIEIDQNRQALEKEALFRAL